MELVSVRIGEAPSAPKRVRLVGDVVYDDRPGQVEPYWFEVPEKYAQSLSLSGNPWITSLLPLAVTLRQPLRIHAPVDPVLFENIPKLMETWAAWYRRRFPWIRPVSVDAPRKATELGPGPRESAAFFSGGVDSFYMVLRNPEIRRLLCVRGFDIPLRVPEEFERLRGRLATAAEELGRDLVDVTTNLRDTRFAVTKWGHLAHGCALAGVALAMEPRLDSVHIAGTHYEGQIRPWGSHPETDPLLSTSRTRFVHEGAGVARSAKTELVSRSDTALRSLHVCYRINSSENCGNCKKCILTMLNLELLGVLSRSATFPKLDLDRVKRTYLKSISYDRLYSDMRTMARAAGRNDVADAVAECLRRSRRLKPLMTALQWLSAKRGVWRIARRVRTSVLAGCPR
jgi:hypothetical protein